MELSEKVKTPFITISQWKNQQEELLAIKLYMEIPKQRKISEYKNTVQIPSTP